MKKLFWAATCLICNNSLAQNSNFNYDDYPYSYQQPQQNYPENYQERSLAIDRQEAYSMYLDNRVKSVDTFWQIRKIYEEEQEKRYAKIRKKREIYLEHHGIKPFNNGEYDTALGIIQWSKELRQSRYDKYRQIFDDLIKKRAYSGLTMEEYYILKVASQEWRYLLSTQKEYYPKEVVSEMIRFILKIDMELRAI